jgi:hypothetical protein
VLNTRRSSIKLTCEMFTWKRLYPDTHVWKLLRHVLCPLVKKVSAGLFDAEFVVTDVEKDIWKRNVPHQSAYVLCDIRRLIVSYLHYCVENREIKFLKVDFVTVITELNDFLIRYSPIFLLWNDLITEAVYREWVRLSMASLYHEQLTTNRLGLRNVLKKHRRGKASSWMISILSL